MAGEIGGVGLGVAYFGNRHPHHARADLAEIAEMGADFAVHTLSEADLRWNPGTMRTLVETGRALDLASWVVPWGVGGVFGGESPSYAVMEHPEACQRDRHGAHLPALCPRRPSFRDVMTDWLDCAAATGAVGCTWDEPHLALLPNPTAEGRWACRCAVCRSAFADRHERPMPAAWDEEVAAFQHDLLLETVRWLVRNADERGLRSSIILLPDERNGSRGWAELARLPGVQSLGLTPYWFFAGLEASEMPAYLARWCRRLVDALAGTDVEPMAWIQAFAVPAGRESELERGVEIMRAEGLASVAVWAFRACAAMSALAPDDPERVWASVRRAFAAAGREETGG